MNRRYGHGRRRLMPEAVDARYLLAHACACNWKLAAESSVAARSKDRFVIDGHPRQVEIVLGDSDALRHSPAGETDGIQGFPEVLNCLFQFCVQAYGLLTGPDKSWTRLAAMKLEILSSSSRRPANAV